MPDLTGMTTDEAWVALDEAGVEWAENYGDDTVFHDLSVGHREADSNDGMA